MQIPFLETFLADKCGAEWIDLDLQIGFDLLLAEEAFHLWCFLVGDAHEASVWLSDEPTWSNSHGINSNDRSHDIYNQGSPARPSPAGHGPADTSNQY